MKPDDLFNVRRIGAVAWSPDGRYAAIEVSRSGHTLDSNIPTNTIGLLDVRTRSMRTITPSTNNYVGFFTPIWSPDGHQLAFLSVDAAASVRVWIWGPGASAPSPLHGLDVDAGLGDPPIAWIGNDSLAVLVWDPGAEKSGNLYFRLLHGRNVADQWRRSLDPSTASVSVLESGRATALPQTRRLVRIDLRTSRQTTLARGGIHQMTVSADQRFIAFLLEQPGVPGQPIAPYFDPASDANKGYEAVLWGTASHLIDATSGAEVDPSAVTAKTEPPAPKPHAAAPPLRPDAELLSTAPEADAALYTADASDGSHLWLCGGSARPMSSCLQIWHANQWVQEIKTGSTQLISYTASDGTPLNAWLLLPPDYKSGTKLPMTTEIYPGRIYGKKSPPDFSLYRNDFEHPQLFAALGYAVLLPSMPLPKNPAGSHSLAGLASGVLPAVDAVIARGIIDPKRVALVGQSDGGSATLGLITQTDRFRSAIASAGFSDLVSLYGTFYGQYRYGDAGPPQKAQVLRMLQMEKGVFGLGGPPWSEPNRYRARSSIFDVSKVETPLMLVHGDLDFIPIQQAEEFFTGLLRQDKRAEFLRYQGEWHTIAGHANVLDLWSRIADWLSETMPPAD